MKRKKRVEKLPIFGQEKAIPWLKVVNKTSFEIVEPLDINQYKVLYVLY